MRDPARIPIVLDAIRKVWEQNPDQRLTQLIRNLAPAYCDMSSALYNLEDAALIRTLPATPQDTPDPHDGHPYAYVDDCPDCEAARWPSTPQP